MKNHHKRLTAIFSFLFMLTALSGCGQRPAEQKELVVFAAASLTESLTKLGEAYEKKTGVRVTFNFDSSGTLKTQISEGAECDVFLSAGVKQMNELDPETQTDNGKTTGRILKATRIDLLENRIVLAAGKGNPKGIRGFDDLALKLLKGTVLLAVGNSDVPVGQYTQRILQYYKLDETALSKKGALTYGSNVKEVTSQIREGTADCGIIYRTDANTAGLEIVDEASAELTGPVIYPAAVVSGSNREKEAKDFLNFLVSGEAAAIFKAAGFSPVSPVK